mgnify:CR=1 FL=1
MGSFLSLPILIIAAAIQASVVPQIRLLGGGPELVFLLVVAWSINAEIEESVVWAFIGGIAYDLLSAAPTGATTLGLLVVVFAVSGLGRQVFRIGFFMMIGIVLFGTFVQQIIFVGVLLFAGRSVSILFDLAYVVAPTMLYNLLLIWPAYWFARRMQRRFVTSRRRVLSSRPE